MSNTGTQFRGFAAPALDLVIMDIPALSDSHMTKPGVYMCVNVSDPREPFASCTLFESTDDPTEVPKMQWTPVFNFTARANMGVLTADLPVGITTGFDVTNVVNFDLVSGNPTSIREGRCLGGQNRFYVGGEILGMKTIEKTGDYSYQGSSLLRGLRNTEQASTIVAGYPVVQLNGPGIYFRELNLASLGTTKYLKLVANGDVVGDQPIDLFVYQGNNLKPFSPCNVVGTRDASNNLTVTFERRTRAIINQFWGLPPPLLEPYEKYDIEVYTTNWAVLKRTTTVTDVTTWSYSAASQTADGLTPGAKVYLKIYQRSDLVWRGFEAKVSV